MNTVPSWDEYFLAISQAVSIRSKDPNTKVGCVLVNKDNHLVASGYNGFAPGTIETPELWNSENKYKRVIHAEVNALNHLTVHEPGLRLYTNMFPCEKCIREIINSKLVSEIIYKKEYRDFTVSSALFLKSGGTVRKL